MLLIFRYICNVRAFRDSQAFMTSDYEQVFVALVRSCLGLCLFMVDPNVAHNRLINNFLSVTEGTCFFYSFVPIRTRTSTLQLSTLPFRPICSKICFLCVVPLHLIQRVTPTPFDWPNGQLCLNIVIYTTGDTSSHVFIT